MFETGMYSGKPACNRHLAGERRSVANEAKRREQYAQGESAAIRAGELVAKLGFGHREYNTVGNAYVGVALTFEEAEAIISLLEESE